MRCLVLGGTVFVGKHLVAQLVAEGHEVTVLNRGRTPGVLPAAVDRLVADRTDPAQMRAALGNRHWDAVFDVSGFVMAAGGSDIDGLIDLLDGKVSRYVYVSSIMAYDQSLGGRFPWVESMPTNTEGPSSYGGFKALAEAAVLARHRTTGFPATVVRPAAIYGPDNNIFDMETPMFLRLLHGRPILVPHEGMVVGSYGHVDDLCAAMVALSTLPAAAGAVVNVTGDSVDVNRYVAALADVTGRAAEVLFVADALRAELDQAGGPPVYGHLFKRRHHALLDTRLLDSFGIRPSFDLASGHAMTFEWFCAQGWQDRTEPLVDPVWRATWDFAAEAAVAERIRRG